ncbi:MAG: nucleotidyltransferase domain-containing protein [bacterium]
MADFEHFGLYEKSYNSILDYFKTQPKIEMVKVYGSRAKGNYSHGSDIDFAVYGDLTSSEISHIAYGLYELPTPYKFDVTHYETLKHAGLKEHIDRVGIVFYERGE